MCIHGALVIERFRILFIFGKTKCLDGEKMEESCLVLGVFELFS